MRYHRTYSQFDLWRDPQRLRRVVDASTLVAARLEPALFSLAGTAAIDLTFSHDREIAVIPLIVIDAAMLVEPDCSPFVWPMSSREALDPAVGDQIEDRLLPWILSLSMGRQLTYETSRTFAAGPGADAFARAAEFGFLGAAPYERVAVAMAPYALAAHSARGRTCRAVDVPEGASGVALLTRTASKVSADLGSAAANEFAARWFGIDVFGSAAREESCDLAIARSTDGVRGAARSFVVGGPDDGGVPIVQPIPLDLLIAFETDDAPARASVNVTLPQVPLRTPYGGAMPGAIGGSDGRILFVAREDFSRLEDSDSDEMLWLAGALGNEGFTVDVVVASAQVDLAEYGLVHLFSLPSAPELERLVQATRLAGTTLVATANLPDVAAQGAWGSRITAAIETMSFDGGLMDERLALVAARKLNAEGMRLGVEPYAGYHAGLARILGLCDGAIVHCPAEGRLLRSRFGFSGELAELAPFALTDEPAQDVNALVGDGEFVFAHAPIGPNSNLLALTRAATSSGLPLVIAGQVADVGYLAALRRWSDGRTSILTSASPGQIAALYRRARVFTDVAWIPGGLARPQRALLSGCRLVLASDSYGGDLWSAVASWVDPASAPAIASGLTAAWEAAAHPETTALEYAGIVAGSDPARTLSATVNLYARAAGARAKA